MTIYHPRKDEQGQLVVLKQPSHPTGQETWLQSDCIATVIPDGLLPAEFPHQSWAPSGEWEALAEKMSVVEPDYPSGKTMSAGAVVSEADGRVWVVSPSNAFGGYRFTFPKGKREHDESLKALALKEVWEEAGLQIRLTAYLGDFVRTTSICRLYLAERIGGNPAEMGWETQAVHLVPLERLIEVLHHSSDHAVVSSLKKI